MKSSIASLIFGLASLARLVWAEDVLISSRMRKRGIDAEGHFNMSFFHVNDVHAHLDEFSSSGTDCDEPKRGCYGGYARIKHTVDTLRPQYNDSLWLNAGDEFQGTLFYAFYKGEKIAETLNQLGFDAMTLGNHEWDDGDDVLGDFLLNLTFPVISANVRSANEKLNKTIKPYVIFEEQQVAVIGCTTDTTATISNVGPDTRFLDHVESVQGAIDEIQEKTDIKRIVALTHIGYEFDQKLAQRTKGLSLIMGGHSHTLLGDMEDAEGKYPTIVENEDGDEVFVVTAYRWGEYVGYVDVTFDDDGKALAYHGGPIHLTNQTDQDPELQAQIEEWRGPFEAFAAEVVGESSVELVQKTCQKEECLLGDFMTDAMLAYRRASSGDDAVDLALINAGGIRAAIDEGNITRGEILTAFPFGNAVVDLTFSGSDLLKIFEGCVSGVSQFNGEPITSFCQVSNGVKIEYNPDNANGTKLVRASVGGQAVGESKDYTIVTLDFLAGGGDNILESTTDFISLNRQDEVLVDYIVDQSPIDIELEGRIVKTDEQAKNGSSGGDGNGDGDEGAAGLVTVPIATAVALLVVLSAQFLLL